MAEAVTHWIRDDVAPTIADLGKSLRGVETLDSFDCRRRNGIADAKIQRAWPRQRTRCARVQTYQRC
jgi:hypothetical protein